MRRPENLGHVLDGWYTPKGLSALLQRDDARAHAELAQSPFDYGFPLRPYQQRAILATEARIRDGQRAILLAMATGTGKTKTCIALIYRLLKAKRFRRILFLVDRSALGEQAANAFKDTRMERLQTIADIFGIKELEDQAPEDDTADLIFKREGGGFNRLDKVFSGQLRGPASTSMWKCRTAASCSPRCAFSAETRCVPSWLN